MMKPYFECEYGVVYNASAETLLNEIRSDLIVTSPPYGTLRKYKGFDFDLGKIAHGVKTCLSDGGTCVWVVADQTIRGCEQLIPFKHAQAMIDAGLSLYDTMIWEKPSPAVPTEGRYYDVFEYMFVFCDGKKPKTLNLLADRKNRSAGFVAKRETRSSREDRRYHWGENSTRAVADYGRRFNVWQISRGHNATPHPAVFPEQLALDHILSWSNEGDVVCDPMAGSGTVALAAMKTGRKFIVNDISTEYCDLMVDRIKKHCDEHFHGSRPS